MFWPGKLQYHPGQLYVKYSWPILVPNLQTQKGQDLSASKEEEDDSCNLDELDLGEISTWSVEQQQAGRKLLCDYSETFSKNDLDLGSVIY